MINLNKYKLRRKEIKNSNIETIILEVEKDKNKVL